MDDIAVLKQFIADRSCQDDRAASEAGEALYRIETAMQINSASDLIEHLDWVDEHRLRLEAEAAVNSMRSVLNEARRIVADAVKAYVGNNREFPASEALFMLGALHLTLSRDRALAGAQPASLDSQAARS